MVNAGSTGEPNEVTRLVIEDTVDAAGAPAYRKVFGLDRAARTLREVFIDSPLASPKYWCQSTTLTSYYAVSQQRMPSAHNVVSEAGQCQFLNPYKPGGDWTNDTATLRTSDGLIHLFEYNADGNRTGQRAKKGSVGGSYYVSAADYFGGTDPLKKHLVTASYDFPAATTTRSQGVATTYSYTFWGSGHVKTVLANLPAISAAQNGSGVSTQLGRYFDPYGRLRWIQDGEGHVTYQSYHPQTGHLAYRVTDADPAALPGAAADTATKWLAPSYGSAEANKPTRAGDLPAALQLVSSWELDEQGRERLRVDTGGKKHWTVYESHRTMVFPYWPQAQIEITNIDGAGRATLSYKLPASRANYDIYSSSVIGVLENYGETLSGIRRSYNRLTGQLESVETFGYLTIHRYDALGRVQTEIQIVSGTDPASRVEQVTQTNRDTLGRVVEVKRGVSQAGHNMGADYATLPPMARISLTQYDLGGVGDGHVTREVRYYDTGPTDNTGFVYHRTCRGDLRGIEPFYAYNAHTGSDTKQAPYTIYDTDWKGRVAATALYTTAPSWPTLLGGNGYTAYAQNVATGRRTLSRTRLDNLGRAYRTEQVTITPSTGVQGNRQVVDQYFDRNDRLVASAPAYSTATEQAYDGAGRQYETRTVQSLAPTKYVAGKFHYRAPRPSPHYSSSNLTAMSGGNDTVVAFTHQVLDGSGNPLHDYSFEANHVDTDGLNLSRTVGVRS